jgi:hypothetical protein
MIRAAIVMNPPLSEIKLMIRYGAVPR